MGGSETQPRCYRRSSTRKFDWKTAASIVVALALLDGSNMWFGGRGGHRRMIVAAFQQPRPTTNGHKGSLYESGRKVGWINRETGVPVNNERGYHRTFASTRLCSTNSPYTSGYYTPSGSSSVDEFLQASGYKRPPVQWYPGHIAKAERQLAETLRVVDVVVEVRDARAPKATSHPRVGSWCAGRPRIVVVTHMDSVPNSSVKAWKDAYMSEFYGAVKNDDEADAQIRNQATQARAERARYGTDSEADSSSSSSSQVTTPVEQVLFVDAKLGQGIHALHRAIFKAGAHVQERRDRRGLRQRALRVGVIGYPNVGKSALINKILGRRRARTANKPGVTRSLQWIRIKSDETQTKASIASSVSKKKEFELLDSPGIIPARMVDQSDAVLLAACNCIGDAAYDNQAVAAYLCEWLKTLHLVNEDRITAPRWREKFIDRYKFDPMEKIPMQDADPYGVRIHNTNDDGSPRMRYRSGEDMLYQVADNTCQGDPEDASRKILQDFRAGRLGPICLQPPPKRDGQDVDVPIQAMDGTFLDASDIAEIKERHLEERASREAEKKARAQAAIETAKERGLELPPIVAKEDNGSDSDNGEDKSKDDDVGKGMFDGW